MTAEPVQFITVEDEKDLIVSFAIGAGDPGEVRSLTLLRTPRYEHLLPATDCGVSVSDEAAWADPADDKLEALQWAGNTVYLQDGERQYQLDVSQVDTGEAAHAREVLQKMNPDGHFRLELANATS
jgi:hypothetical protein